MNADIFVHSATTMGLSFVFSLVGCLLALHSFVRGLSATGRGRRFAWFLLGAWALAASAIWEMFFIAVIDLQTGGLPVRYENLSIIVNIAASVILSAGALWLVALKATAVRILLIGALLGAVMAADTVFVLTAIRVNAIVTFSLTAIVGLTILMAIATAPTLLLALRSTRRGAVLGASVILALMLTVIHYLAQYTVTFTQQPSVEPVTSGIIPLAVTLPVMIVVIARVLLLLVVLLSNTATPATTTPTAAHRAESPTAS